MEKERRTKALLLSTLVVVVATLSIAFAAMSRTLSINGIAKMDTASWSVYFDNLSNATTVRGAKEVGKPNISTIDNGILENIKVRLSNPKDEISYTVDIVNDGTIDAEITMIKDIELTDVQKKVFEFKVTYTDTGEVLQNGDILPKDTTKNITINIKFKDDITEFDLPLEAQTINLSYQVTYTQYDGGNIPIIPDGGGEPEKISFLFYESINVAPPMKVFNGTIARKMIESISFENNTSVPSEAASTVWDASAEGDNSILGWYTDIDNNGLNEVYIGSDAKIYAPSDLAGMFAMYFNLKEINFNNFNTSQVTDMSSMFYISDQSLLNNLDLSSFDTSKVTNISQMFAGCSSLTSLDLSSFDTSNVTNMWGMFGGCSSLTSLDLSSFNTSKVTDISSMFGGCSKLTSLDLSSFNTSNVTNMRWMFCGCSSLTSLDLSKFNTLNVTDMSDMFNGCTSLTSIDFRNADFSSVINYVNMFAYVNTEATRIIVKDEIQRTWITSKFPELTNVVLPSEL